MTRLRTSDLQALLAFVEDAQTIGGDEPFTPELLDRLTSLMRCEFAAFSELDLVRRVVVSYVGCSNETTPSTNPLDDVPHDLAAELLRRQRRNDDVSFLSDGFSRAARVRFDYDHFDCSCFEEWGVVDHAVLRIGPPSVSAACVILESQERDFGARDRQLAERLRTTVAALCRNAEIRRRLAAALAALDTRSTDEGPAVIVLGRGARPELVTPAARRILTDWFGTDAGRLPAELDAWVRNEARRPRPSPSGQRPAFVASRRDRRLVVDAAGAEVSTLLLEEQTLPTARLTGREWDVMRCIAAGMSTEETARLLFVERSTIRKHLEHVFDKLGVASRVAAVAKLGPVLAASSGDATHAGTGGDSEPR